MTYKDVANSVSKFGGILFTSIRLTAVVCYAAGPLKVRLSFRSQNVPTPPPKPLHKHRYTWSVNKVMRLPAFRTIWQHCRLTPHVKGR